MNNVASIVLLGTPIGSIVSKSLNSALDITFVWPSLYTIVNSYSKNNNNHLPIRPYTCGLFTKQTKAI
jgi:hypothetical protein